LELLTLLAAKFRLKQRTRGKTFEWSAEDLQEMLEVFVRSPYWKPTMLFVDALDEGDENEVRSLLTFLERLAARCTGVHGTTLSVFLSSRHYPNIFLRDCVELWAESHNAEDIATPCEAVPS
jgi:hypothetical protein